MDTPTPKPGIKVVATDLLTGEVGEVVIQPGQYLVICAEPKYLASEQRYGNGTAVITLKRRATSDTPTA